MKRYFLLTVISLIGLASIAADKDSLLLARKRLNLVVSNKSPRLDAASISIHVQAWWNQLFHRRKMRVIVVKTMEEAVERIEQLMVKEKAMIGDIWFDSHGHMGRRLAVLEIGDVELNYESIREPWISKKVSAIGRFCDSSSRVVLGSCYSAAGYFSAGAEGFPPRRMNGDSLMMEAAPLFNGATIFGTVSWITTRPGFFNGRYASAGNPWAKRFKDTRFSGAWDSLGSWKSYGQKNGLRLCNTVSMDHSAEIRIQEKAYLDIPKYKKRQQKRIGRLKEGNFPDRFFDEYKDPLHVRRNKIPT